MGRKGGGRSSKERHEINGEIGSGQAISAWEEQQPGRAASRKSAAFSAARCRSSPVNFHTNGRRQCCAEITGARWLADVCLNAQPHGGRARGGGPFTFAHGWTHLLRPLMSQSGPSGAMLLRWVASLPTRQGATEGDASRLISLSSKGPMYYGSRIASAPRQKTTAGVKD